MTNNKNKLDFIAPSINSYDNLMTQNVLATSSRIVEDTAENKVKLANEIFENIELNNPEVISFLSSNGISYNSSKKFIEDVSLLTLYYFNK